MPTVSPCNCRLVKKVNDSFLIAVTYSNVPNHPDQLDVSIELVNTKKSKSDSSNIKSPDSEDDTENTPQNNTSSDSWFGGFFLAEKRPLAATETPEVPLFLGYVQMIGYVRLNRQIGSDDAQDSSTNIYWKNSDYLSNYDDTADSVFDGILETPFMKDHGSSLPRKGRIGGISDLHVHRFDQTAIYLLHDLAYSFNTREMPVKNAPAVPEAHHNALASDLSECIIPFYVTAQHLLFSSLRLEPGARNTFNIRIPKPTESMPPSYNTRLTGSAGESGAVSICYLFVVGVLEQSAETMKPRAVYFPMELRPGIKGLDRDWLQQDYLQDTLVDKDWSPIVLGGPQATGENVSNTSLNGSSQRTEKRFIRDLDTLIESSMHVVAANERRKSSVPFLHEYSGYLQQVPLKLKILYQIRVNNQTLCIMTLSKPYFHAGDDVQFFLELYSESDVSTRVVGYTCHVEAHEIFNLETTKRVSIPTELAKINEHPYDEGPKDQKRHDTNGNEDISTKDGNGNLDVTNTTQENSVQDAPNSKPSSKRGRKVVNFYKVTPTIKINTFAGAMADAFHKTVPGIVASKVNLPRFLTQQFQASSFMDLKYFLVCRFVLNDFTKTEGPAHIDDEPKRYTDYIQEYKLENESTEFKFLIPVTVLP